LWAWRVLAGVSGRKQRRVARRLCKYAQRLGSGLGTISRSTDPCLCSGQIKLRGDQWNGPGDGCWPGFSLRSTNRNLYVGSSSFTRNSDEKVAANASWHPADAGRDLARSGRCVARKLPGCIQIILRDGADAQRAMSGPACNRFGPWRRRLQGFHCGIGCVRLGNAEWFLEIGEQLLEFGFGEVRLSWRALRPSRPDWFRHRSVPLRMPSRSGRLLLGRHATVGR